VRFRSTPVKIAAMHPSIILLSPVGNFYAYLLSGLARAFNAYGYVCAWRNEPVDLQSIQTILRQFDVAACFEINRVLQAGMSWPRNVAHVCWINDHRFNGKSLVDDLGASDHIYLIVDPSRWSIDLGSRRWSILLPGARDDVRGPIGTEMPRDFCFAGFMPEPLNGDSPVAFMPDGRPVTLTEFLRIMPPDTLWQSRKSLTKIKQALARTCESIGCGPITESVMQVFDEILPRIIERKNILEAIIGLGSSIDIFGSPNWQLWPQFAPFHRGLIENPADLDPIFQSTRINLHNGGIPMHFRVVDCLAAGGFLLANETAYDFADGGIRHYLEPGRHYVSYSADNIAPVATYYLADEQARTTIAAEGRREILASHTWMHRAAQILDDLNLSIPSPQPPLSDTLQTARRLQTALDLAAKTRT
jgi:hypothetical protein